MYCKNESKSPVLYGSTFSPTLYKGQSTYVSSTLSQSKILTSPSPSVITQMVVVRDEVRDNARIVSLRDVSRG